MSDDVLMGRYGSVSAGGALAAGAAMQVLRDGGNAVDAAIAGSAVQCVTEMPWCGVAGDAFALIRLPSGSTVGLNGSGATPAGVIDALGGLTKVPRFGAVSAAVPAIVDAWVSLHERYGSVPFEQLVEPARRYAADGIPLDRRLCNAFTAVLGMVGGDQLAPLVADTPLRLGATFRQADLADTLEAIATTGGDEFYRGVIAKQIVDHVAERGGALSADDLAEHAGLWVPPMQIDYRGNTVFSNGPVSTGVLLLACLRALEACYPDGVPDDDIEVTDTLVRLKHLAFGELLPTLGDPAFAGDTAANDLLTDDCARRLAASVAAGRPSRVAADVGGTDTTSLAVSSADGMAITFIHSLFNEFGARELVPGTGIVLNDRLANLQVGDRPNSLRPGQRPMHTLHCYLVDRTDGSMLTGATPGGRGQVQTNLQVLVDVLDRDSDPQAAVARPRWVNGMPRVAPDDTTLYLESALGASASALTERGHVVEIVDTELDDHFGNCTVVGRSADGEHHIAVADERRAGHAEVW